MKRILAVLLSTNVDMRGKQRKNRKETKQQDNEHKIHARSLNMPESKKTKENKPPEMLVSSHASAISISVSAFLPDD